MFIVLNSKNINLVSVRKCVKTLIIRLILKSNNCLNIKKNISVLTI